VWFWMGDAMGGGYGLRDKVNEDVDWRRGMGWIGFPFDGFGGFGKLTTGVAQGRPTADRAGLVGWAVSIEGFGMVTVMSLVN
jgi:hypothetical protein